MPKELMLYILADIAGGSLSLFLCLYAFVKFKNAPGGKSYIFASFLCSFFAFAYGFELSGRSLAQMKFWLKVEYLALPFIPVFILLMCMEYAGKKVPKLFLYPLFGIPVTTVFLHHTNDFHHFYYSSVGLKENTPFMLLDLEGGPWFVVHSFFLYACVTASISMLLMMLRKVSFRFRMQILMMITGLLIPIAASVFYVTGASGGIDLGPVSMSVSFIFHGIALISFQMFNVAPIAKETIFENMEDGFIVLNQNNAIVDFNRAALQVMPNLTPHVIGKPLKNLLQANSLLARLIDQKQDCDYELEQNGGQQFFRIRFSVMENKQGQMIGMIIAFISITERVQMEQALQKLASIDGLTQIFNRTFFLKKAVEITAALSASNQFVSVMMCDIDHFKKVNDTFGHEAGDAVLVHMVRVVQAQLREKDLIGRYGGEEFVVLLPETHLEEASELARSICSAVAESGIIINGEKITITSSFGLASMQAECTEAKQTVQLLMKQADAALYAAKRNGRNNVAFYHEKSF